MIPKIGLELHIRLKTASKLFSSAANTLHSPPNAETTSYDWAYPGSLPVVNELAVRLAVRAANIMHFKVASTLTFDRKNYYYFDLPKGYQITQFRNPIGRDGKIDIFLKNNIQKTIRLQFVALEEDTAKTIYQNQEVWLDYNRVGVPLIELTTAPDFHNGEEVRHFLQTVFSLFRQGQISDCQFEWGTVRVDVNISVTDSKGRAHPRTEVKNLNSLANIEKAILLEIAHQSQNLKKDLKIPHKAWTKRFDEKKQILVDTRTKMSAFDYLYIPEGNLLPFALSAKLLNEEKKHGEQIFQNYNLSTNNYGLDRQDSRLIFADNNLKNLFLFLHQQKISTPTIVLFFRELLINKKTQHQIKTKHYPDLEKLLQAYLHKEINFRDVKKLFLEILVGKKLNITEFLKIKESHFANFSRAQLKIFLSEILTNDETIRPRFRERPDTTIKYLMGKLMQKTQGKADPQLCRTLIQEMLQK